MYYLELDDVDEEQKLYLGSENTDGEICVAYGDDGYFYKYADWLEPIMDNFKMLGVGGYEIDEITEIFEDDFIMNTWTVYADGAGPVNSFTYCLAWADPSLEKDIDKYADGVYQRLFKKLSIDDENYYLGGKLLYARLGSDRPLIHPNIGAYMKQHKTFTVEDLEEFLDNKRHLHRIKTSAGEIVLCWSSDVPDKDLKFPVPPLSPHNSIFDDDDPFQNPFT